MAEINKELHYPSPSIAAGLILVFAVAGTRGSIGFTLTSLILGALVVLIVATLEYFSAGLWPKPAQIIPAVAILSLAYVGACWYLGFWPGERGEYGFIVLVAFLACYVFQLDESGRKRVSAESYLAFAFIAACVSIAWPIAVAALGGTDLNVYLSALWDGAESQDQGSRNAAADKDAFAALRSIGPFFLLAALTALYRKILGITEE
jgi:hypothetical protein